MKGWELLSRSNFFNFTQFFRTIRPNNRLATFLHSLGNPGSTTTIIKHCSSVTQLLSTVLQAPKSLISFFTFRTHICCSSPTHSGNKCDSIEAFLNYTKLAMLSIKTYIGKSKINSAQLPPVGIEPRTS